MSLMGITYGFLYLTVIALWIPKLKKIHPWWITLTLSLLFALASGAIDFMALPAIALLPVSAWSLKNKTYPTALRVLGGTVLFVIGAGLILHKLPGFHNLRIIHQAQISENAIPFTLYLNFDKTLLGIFIIALLQPLITSKREWIKVLKATLLRAIVVIAVVGILAFALKFVTFDPKLPSQLAIWTLTNLLFVCLAEEAFFRGFIQQYLCKLMRFKYGAFLAVALAALLFGAYHYKGGVLYMLLAFIAGMGYGWIYYRTKRIEASILTHFALNLLHILFFTYPALTSAFF